MTKKQKIAEAECKCEEIRQAWEIQDALAECNESMYRLWGLFYQRSVQSLNHLDEIDNLTERKKQEAQLIDTRDWAKQNLIENHRLSYMYIPLDPLPIKTVYNEEKYNIRDLMKIKDEYFAPGTVMRFKDEFLEEQFPEKEIRYPFAMYDGFDHYDFDREGGCVYEYIRFKFIAQDDEPDFQNLHQGKYTEMFVISDVLPQYEGSLIYCINVKQDHIIMPEHTECEVTQIKTPEFATQYFYMGDLNSVHCHGTIVKFHDVELLKTILKYEMENGVIKKIKYPYAKFDYYDRRLGQDGKVYSFPRFVLISQYGEPNLKDISHNIFEHSFHINDCSLSKASEIIYDIKANEPHYRRATPFDVRYWWLAVLACIAVILASLMFNPLRIPVCIGAPIFLIGWWVAEYKKMVKRLKD